MIKDFEQLSLNLSQGHPLYDKIIPKKSSVTFNP